MYSNNINNQFDSKKYVTDALHYVSPIIDPTPHMHQQAAQTLGNRRLLPTEQDYHSYLSACTALASGDAALQQQAPHHVLQARAAIAACKKPSQLTGRGSALQRNSKIGFKRIHRKRMKLSSLIT